MMHDDLVENSSTFNRLMHFSDSEYYQFSL